MGRGEGERSEPSELTGQKQNQICTQGVPPKLGRHLEWIPGELESQVAAKAGIKIRAELSDQDWKIKCKEKRHGLILFLCVCVWGGIGAPTPCRFPGAGMEPVPQLQPEPQQ